jgi:outer membrane receptor protein involved in Fe transport
MLGFNTSKTWFTQLGSVDTQYKLGLQTRYDHLSPVALYNTAQRKRTSLIRADQVDETSAGIFVENTTQWHPQLRTLAGLRYDRYQFEVDSSIAGNTGQARDGITSPKLS